MMPEKWHPHAGQRKGVKFLLEHACSAIFADPGVGKTSMVYAAFSYLKKRDIANRMLIVAPLRPCYSVWPAEAEKWSDFEHLTIAVLHGKDKDKALASGADVCVINPEGLDWLFGVSRAKSATGRVKVTVASDKEVRALGFDTLVIDELTMAKSVASGRHKILRAIQNSFSRRWGLTGTPAPNGLMDLFGQALVLDGGRTFGPYITHFREQYFIQSYDGRSYHLKDGADKRIHERLKPLALRLAAEDYVDMPAHVDDVRRFDLSPKVRKIYDLLEEEMIIEIGDRTITALTAASVSTKCRQIANGGIYATDVNNDPAFKAFRHEREWVRVHDGKTALLDELVDELQGTPVLVAYEFQHDLIRLKEWFTRRWGVMASEVPVIGGGTTPKRAVELERAWNLGQLPVLLGHPQSMGHGLNLQKSGNHVCWYGQIWNLELYDQFNRRVRRQGSAHQTVFIHHLIARGTIDETVYYTLRSKAKTQNALLDALKTSVRKRRAA